MNKSLRQLVRASAATLALLFAQAAAIAQDDVALTKLAEGRALQAEGRAEDAAFALRAAREAAEAVQDANVRKSLLKPIEQALGETDTLAADARKAEEAAARALLRAARGYQARKWHRMALPYLQLAASVSAAVAGKALELADAATTTTDAIRAWFSDGKTFAGGGVWKVTANSVESPKLTGASLGFRSEKSTKGKTRIAIETRASDAPSKSSIVFGMKPDTNGDSYYVVELRHYRGGSQLRLLHNPQSGAIVEIANHPLTLSRAERADWVELWVELAGDRVRVGVGDWESLEANAVTADLDGCIGLFISGDSPFPAPIAFRNLRVEPL
jgi:hypothetical protein